MWFRVEFNRDGSVRETTAVEARGIDDRLVVYVDAASTTSAVTEALVWRKKYLEAARANHHASRERMNKVGVCMSCFKRGRAAGRRRCEKCLAVQKARRQEPYLVKASIDVTDDSVLAVRAAIHEQRGKYQVSADNIKAALTGQPVSQYVAANVASGVRALGSEASISVLPQGPRKRGGRWSLNDTELELMLLVRQRHQSLSGDAFAEWLDSEIDTRKRRNVEDSRGKQVA